MKIGRVLPKVIRGQKLNLRNLIGKSNIDFIYVQNAQWQYPYKRTLDSGIYKSMLMQIGDEITIDEFKFIINGQGGIRFMISTGYFLYEMENAPVEKHVKMLMNGMICIYASYYEPMYAWLQMRFGEDFMPYDEWKNIIRENGFL